MSIILPDDEREWGVKCVQTRLDAIDSKYHHLIAAFLDHRYKRQGLKEEEEETAMDTIITYAIKCKIIDENKVSSFADEIITWRTGTGNFKVSFLFESKICPSSWWKQFKNSSLALVAARVLSVPASSASVERSFSKQGFIHSKSRNRMSHDRTRKQLLIACDHQCRTGAARSLKEPRDRSAGVDDWTSEEEEEEKTEKDNEEIEISD